MSKEVPEKLYRGVKLDYNMLKNFKFSGYDMKPPNEPLIDEQGRKTVGDGNEYGVYMSDNRRMVEDAYGRLEITDGTAIDKKIVVGSREDLIKIPAVGIIYEIESKGIENLHIPWITEVLKSHYNNGFSGDEWIAEIIPKQNYRIDKIKIGEDLLHDEENIDTTDMVKAEEETKKVIEERKARLEKLAKELSKYPKSKLKSFNHTELNMIKNIYGKDGSAYTKLEDIDMSSAKEVTKYLSTKSYNDNSQSINFDEQKYIQMLRDRIERDKDKEGSKYVIEIITKDIEKNNNRRQQLIENGKNKNREVNTKSFDLRNKIMQGFIDDIQAREKQLENQEKKLEEPIESKQEENKKSEDNELENLIDSYYNANNAQKKKILIEIQDSRMFDDLVSRLSPESLIKTAKIYPYKEVLIDALIDNLEAHKNGNKFLNNNFEDFSKAIKHQSFINKVKTFFTKKPAFPESIPRKLESLKQLAQLEVNRRKATGKKYEQIEKQDIKEPAEESRVEINTGEMAQIFDRSVQKSKDTPLIEVLENEYIQVLEDENIGKLVAKSEMQNLGDSTKLYNPYIKNGTAWLSPGAQRKRAGLEDTREWKKNLMEVEQVDNFTVSDKNLGTIYVLKSEILPSSSYTYPKKWAPVYEYFSKDENGELIRIGDGKLSRETGKLENTINLNNEENIEFKEEGYIGESTKITRKDIEQAIASKSIQDYLGNNKEIADITQIKEMPVVNRNNTGQVTNYGNTYLVSSVENGQESYEMVYIGSDGKCKKHPQISQNMFSKENRVNIPTGLSTGMDKNTSSDVFDNKKVEQNFKSSDGNEYSAYRDNDGVLRFGQILKLVNRDGKYLEEVDTYSLIHNNIEEIKKEANSNKSKELGDIKLKQSKIKTEDAR